MPRDDAAGLDELGGGDRATGRPEKCGAGVAAGVA
jgi:hypothetical protein